MTHKMNLPMKIMMTCAGTLGKLGTSRVIKLSIKDREAFRKSIKYLTDLDIEEVIPNHGDSISKTEFIKWTNNF